MPSIETPIQIEILDTFLNNNELYYQKARESTELVGKDDFNQIFKVKPFITDSDEPIQHEDQIPAYMISQVSGRPIRDPVLASSGVYYERNELRRIVSSRRNPVCVVTGRVLTERSEEI